jgi:iron complex transport system substrate-binding protein
VGKSFRFVVIALILLVISGVTGCAQSSPPQGQNTREFRDAVGRVVKFNKVPQRIISLAPSNTEILFAIGLGDRVVGVTEYCNYPPEVKGKTKIGGYSNPDIEKVVSLSPDMILATAVHNTDVIPALEKQGLTVFAIDPKSLNEVMESISLVGKITGQEVQADQVVSKIGGKIKEIESITAKLPIESKPRVFHIIWNDPLMTAGSGTFNNEFIRIAGGVNIAENLKGYPTITLETVLAANPQIIVAGVNMGDGGDAVLQFAMKEPRLKDTDARKNNRLYGIDSDIVGRPGPRVLEALEQYAAIIHPEIFKSGK